MKKVKAIIDILTLVVFAILAISGMIFLIFPTKESWSELHESFGVVMIIIGIVHLVIHWDHIKGLRKSLKEKK